MTRDFVLANLHQHNFISLTFKFVRIQHLNQNGRKCVGQSHSPLEVPIQHSNFWLQSCCSVADSFPVFKQFLGLASRIPFSSIEVFLL